MGKTSRYAAFVSRKKRAYAPPLLWDGLPDAIRNLRKSKELFQAQAAERGGTTKDTWSQWERRTKRLLREHLPIVTKGLGVTEFQLHLEAARLQEQHYNRLAAEVREPRPIYDTSITSGVIGSLPQGTGELPPELEDWHNKLTNATASVVSVAMNLAECVKEGPKVLGDALSATAADDDDGIADRSLRINSPRLT